jgi:hypothetical protein
MHEKSRMQDTHKCTSVNTSSNMFIMSLNSLPCSYVAGCICGKRNNDLRY